MTDPRTDMPPDLCRQYLAFAEELADESRKIIAEASSEKPLVVWRKNNREPVTNLDVEIERRWVSRIKKRFPEHGILGEETGTTGGRHDIQWVLDPIDGTDDFIRGIPLYGSIIAATIRGHPFVGLIDHPALNLRCVGAFGLGAHLNGTPITISRNVEVTPDPTLVLPSFADIRKLENADDRLLALHAAFPNSRTYRNVYGHTLVASGRISACLEVKVSVWDILATQIIVEEAGGCFQIVERTGSELMTCKVTVAFGDQNSVGKVIDILRC